MATQVGGKGERDGCCRATVWMKREGQLSADGGEMRWGVIIECHIDLDHRQGPARVIKSRSARGVPGAAWWMVSGGYMYSAVSRAAFSGAGTKVLGDSTCTAGELAGPMVGGLEG